MRSDEFERLAASNVLPVSCHWQVCASLLNLDPFCRLPEASTKTLTLICLDFDQCLYGTPEAVDYEALQSQGATRSDLPSIFRTPPSLGIAEFARVVLPQFLELAGYPGTKVKCLGLGSPAQEKQGF